jgi:hypothetical protein
MTAISNKGEQRELRFRAWHDENGMLGPYGFTDSFWQVTKNRNLVYMQYTGRKDKAGVEIYEGDIVRFNVQEGREGIYRASNAQSNRNRFYGFCGILWRMDVHLVY